MHFRADTVEGLRPLPGRQLKDDVLSLVGGIPCRGIVAGRYPGGDEDGGQQERERFQKPRHDKNYG